MFRPKLVVLTNDDGVDAPGLAALVEATRGLGGCRVIAPLGPQSGCGHVVTTHRPIAMVERPDGRIAVDGTPADCVRLAIHRFGARDRLGPLRDQRGRQPRGRPPPLGHGRRGPRGRDPRDSGDRDLALHRPRPARSTGTGRPDGPRPVLADLMARPPEPGTFWNVNLPHPEPGGPDPEVVFCPVDPSPLPLAFREEPGGLVYCGDYQGRPRLESSDVAVCFGGRIAVSKVHVMASVWPGPRAGPRAGRAGRRSDRRA